MKENTKQPSNLCELAMPLIQCLKENYHPHTAIVVTDERVAVVETVLSIPEESNI